MKRRHLLQIAVAASTGSAGCLSNFTNATRVPAHTVTVYHVDQEVTRNVSIVVQNDAGETLFEESYTLSETNKANEANEDATFPESSDPTTVLVTVDGTEFERDWPDPECTEGNWAGVEVWIRGKSDANLDIEIKENCQHVYIDS